MMPRIFALILLLAVVATSFQVSCAEVLTLDQSVDLALKNNFGVIQARNAYSISRTQVLTGWGSILPSLSISTGVSQRWPYRGSIYNPVTGRFYTGKNVYSGQLSAQVSYPGLGLGTYANIKQLNHSRASSFYALSSTQSSLVLTVKQTYFNVLRAKMLVGVDSESVKRSEERLRVTQSRYDLGSAAMSDVLRAKVQLATDQLSLVSDISTYRSTLANLAFIMGVDVNREFDVTEKLPEVSSDITFDAALNEAFSNNPDYRRAGSDLAAARDAVLSSVASFLPDLSLSLSHSNSSPSFSEFADMRGYNASRTLSAGLSFNIFSNFTDYARLHAARRNANTASENVKNTKNGVALAVRQAFLDLDRSKQQRSLTEQSVASAQEDYNLVKEKYDLGAATILDLLDAEVALKQAQIIQVQSLFDYNIAVANLDKAMGR